MENVYHVTYSCRDAHSPEQAREFGEQMLVADLRDSEFESNYQFVEVTGQGPYSTTFSVLVPEWALAEELFHGVSQRVTS